MRKSWHTLTKEEIKSFFKTRDKGLTANEARQRLKEHGLNKLAEGAKESNLKIFLYQFKDFLILILISATLISFLLGEVVDALIILSIIIISAFLGFIQEYRSQKAVLALKKLAAPEATVIRDNQVQKIRAERVIPGDILVLQTGDKVAADARLLEEIGLEANEAVLTGESLPVEKEDLILKDKDIPLAERKNMVYSGTIISRGHARAIVIATGMETEFGQVAKMLTEIKPEKTPLEKRLERVGRILGIGSLIICGLAAGLGVFKGYPTLEMFLWGVSLAVAAVPEALPAVVTGSLSIGVWEMAKRKAIVRRLPAVETLGSVSVICSDKTGTLTKNEMTVKEVFVNKETVYIGGSGYAPRGGFLIKKGEYDWQKDEEFLLLMKTGGLCNDASLIHKKKEWQITGDPTEGALLVLARKAGLGQKQLNQKLIRLGEVAFDMTRKRMSTVHQLAKDKYLVAVKGAPESILSVCNRIQNKGKIKPCTKLIIKKILSQNNKMCQRALRVLALAYKEVEKKSLPQDLDRLEPVDLEKDLIFLGLAGMIDPPREEAGEAIRACFSAGIKPIIVTGDHHLTTLSIGREIGLFDSKKKDQIIEGRRLDKISDKQLLKIIDQKSYARVSPGHKLRIVELLQKKGYVVAMTGDGINDAPALKKADIGIAMGIAGTDVTKEASGMILADDNFATIVSAVRKGREIFANIKKYLFYLLRCNIGEVLVLGSGFFFGLPPILSAIQILWINLVTDGLPALALGVDPPDRQVMKQKPIPPEQSIFSQKAIILMFVLSLNMVLVLLPQFSYLIIKFDLIKAQTIVFVTMILMEMINAYNSRSEDSLTRSNPFANKWLNLAVLSSVLLTIIIVQAPVLARIFKTSSLSFGEWGLALALSFSAFLVSEASKALLNKKYC